MSLITRYVLRLYITAIVVSLVAFVSIFFVVDLIEQLDRFLDREVAPVYIALYYVYYTPYIFVLTIPVSLLLASLYTFGQLTRQGELTAMKASGLSLYRLLRPMLLVSAVVSAGLFWAGEWLVPHTSMKRAEIRSEHVDMQGGEGQHVRHEVYFLGEGGSPDLHPRIRRTRGGGHGGLRHRIPRQPRLQRARGGNRRMEGRALAAYKRGGTAVPGGRRIVRIHNIRRTWNRPDGPKRRKISCEGRNGPRR